MQEMMLKTPVDVLNYALTLEHLEYAFYRDGLGVQRRGLHGRWLRPQRL